MACWGYEAVHFSLWSTRLVRAAKVSFTLCSGGGAGVCAHHGTTAHDRRAQSQTQVQLASIAPVRQHLLRPGGAHRVRGGHHQPAWLPWRCSLPPQPPVPEAAARQAVASIIYSHTHTLVMAGRQFQQPAAPLAWGRDGAAGRHGMTPLHALKGISSSRASINVLRACPTMDEPLWHALLCIGSPFGQAHAREARRRRRPRRAGGEAHRAPTGWLTE